MSRNTKTVLSGLIPERKLARSLSKHVMTLRRWHEKGIGPRRLRCGRAYMYTEESVREWLRRCSESTGSPRPDAPSANRSREARVSA